jgi:hypothetical protein
MPHSASSSSRARIVLVPHGSLAVPVIAPLGHGDVELAKLAHLAIDFALASVGVPLAALLQRVLAAECAA